VATVLTRPANSALPIVNANANPSVLTNSLGQNYPNPFENETHIPFTISATENVKLVLYDINGRVVKVLVNAAKDAGKHVVNFNAASLAKGIYYYRIQAGDFTYIKKLIIF
ncbi:MAG: T9SS type A sorting domain-containing protein, partial [Gloeobacteraceae cyanobacterium ES-bin-316]|nr:T9SS type A sorting domain-containing protein [Ferruginibacter sp.]